MKVIARNLFERPVILLFLTLTCLIPLSPFIQACPPDTHDCGSETAALAAASGALGIAAVDLMGAQSRLDAARGNLARLSSERDGAYRDHRNALDTRDRDRRTLADATHTAYVAYAAFIAALFAIELDWPVILLALSAFKCAKDAVMSAEAAVIADDAAVRDSGARYDSARRAIGPAESELSTAGSLYDAAKAAYDAARVAYDRALGAWSSCTGS